MCYFKRAAKNGVGHKYPMSALAAALIFGRMKNAHYAPKKQRK